MDATTVATTFATTLGDGSVVHTSETWDESTDTLMIVSRVRETDSTDSSTYVVDCMSISPGARYRGLKIDSIHETSCAIVADRSRPTSASASS